MKVEVVRGEVEYIIRLTEQEASMLRSVCIFDSSVPRMMQEAGTPVDEDVMSPFLHRLLIALGRAQNM